MQNAKRGEIFMDIAKEAWATALGRMILLILEDQEKMHEITELAESSSIRVLQKIQEILNDDELDDFACVEEIVTVFECVGYSTTRHDFG